MEKFKAFMGSYGWIFILVALGIGLWIGSQWSTWFPKTTDTILGRSDCPKKYCITKGGVTTACRDEACPE